MAAKLHKIYKSRKNMAQNIHILQQKDVSPSGFGISHARTPIVFRKKGT